LLKSSHLAVQKVRLFLNSRNQYAAKYGLDYIREQRHTN
jgi:hypothetical protein